ncbi:diguanylate cyclase domain-containing protein [Agrobacterium pusense]|uniref:diguanylate cyclase domain-containing protein n=1 Tax=Agrobacterium pusense TaxID=648995 RepID=UPI003D13365F
MDKYYPTRGVNILCLNTNNLVGRLGGDEFMIGLAADVSEPDHMASTANAILSIIRAPIDIQGTEIFVDASIGIAVGAGENDRLDELLRMADLSLYSVKRSGKGGWHINSSV